MITEMTEKGDWSVQYYIRSKKNGVLNCSRVKYS